MWGKRLWLKQKPAEILVACARGGGEGWDGEVAGDMEQGSSPGRLLLGALGVVRADISIKGDQSRGGPGTGGGLSTQATGLCFLCIPSFEPRAWQSSNKCLLWNGESTGIGLHAARKSAEPASHGKYSRVPLQLLPVG